MVGQKSSDGEEGISCLEIKRGGSAEIGAAACWIGSNGRCKDRALNLYSEFSPPPCFALLSGPVFTAAGLFPACAAGFLGVSGAACLQAVSGLAVTG